MQEKKGRGTSQFVSVVQPFITYIHCITSCYIPMMDNIVNLTRYKVIREKPPCTPLRSGLG